MTAEVRLAEYGVVFATRQRAEEIIAAIPPADTIEIIFDGVLASTSGFLDELLGALAERSTEVGLSGMTLDLEKLTARIVARRGIGSRFIFREAEEAARMGRI